MTDLYLVPVTFPNAEVANQHGPAISLLEQDLGGHAGGHSAGGGRYTVSARVVAQSPVSAVEQVRAAVESHWAGEVGVVIGEPRID